MQHSFLCEADYFYRRRACLGAITVHKNSDDQDFVRLARLHQKRLDKCAYRRRVIPNRGNYGKARFTHRVCFALPYIVLE